VEGDGEPRHPQIGTCTNLKCDEIHLYGRLDGIKVNILFALSSMMIR